MSTQTDLYTEILGEVNTLVKRPDLSDEVEAAISAATRSIHARAHFPRDVTVAEVKLPNAAYLVSLDIQVQFPGFRGVSSLRALDVNFAPLANLRIEVVEMGDIYDPIYGHLRNDIAYVAGTALNIRCSANSYGFLVEYFTLPSVRPATYNSWIAQLYPTPIIYQAAAIVFSTNGNEEKSAKYQKMVDQLFMPELISNYLTTAAR